MNIRHSLYLFAIAFPDPRLRNRMAFPLGAAVALLLLTASFNPVFAQVAPPLGSPGFAILGASTVTNTGPTIINGDLGVSPGTAITGFPPGIVNGTMHAADAAAAQAQLDASVSYNFLAAEACTTNLSGTDLGGLTLTPGVYCFNSSASLTGTLTLDPQGSPNPVFIFKIGSTLTTASNSAVVLVNGGKACNVYFQVGSSAALGTGTQFMGNIFANASVTLSTNARLLGRAVGLNGAVTLDSNVVSIQTCNAVQVCKVAGAGVAVGTPFTFNVAGTPVTVPAGPAPLGTCAFVPVTVLGSATAVITETLPAGIALTAVSTLPSAGLLISSNLAAGTATVTLSEVITTVTFIDAAVPAGIVQVCKVAGPGVAAGTNFTFNIAGTPVTVPAGLAPLGTCSAPLTVPAGAAVITETLPVGTLLTGVSTLPSAGLLISSNLAAGTATVTVTPGGQTIVTFINAVIPVVPTNGFVQVCKIAGAGVALGTNFTFNVAGTPVTVAAGPAPGGTCSTALSLPAGPAVITETLPVGTLLTGVSTLPSAGLLISSNLAAGTATVTVTPGGQTIVTFINAVIPVVPTNGFVQVCKIAGVGVALGTTFTFNVAGTPVAVPAGPAPGGTCSAALSVPAGAAVITETLPAGIALTSVTTLPAGSLISSNLAAGTATVTVTTGATTIVTFTDAAVPPVPPSISKAFGAPVFPINGNTSLTFVLTNPNPVGIDATFSDTLPAGLIVANPSGQTTTCGAAVAVPGSNSITLTGFILANSSCTLSLNVTGTSAGVKVNTTSPVTTSVNGGLVGNAATATTIVALPPTISKAFGVAVLPINGVTNLTFNIGNPNSTTGLSGVSVVDNLPAGLKVATPNGQATTCVGTVTAIAGSGSISLAAGTLPISGSCTITVNVTGVAAGLQINVTDRITSIEVGTDGSATARITVGGNFLISYAANLTSGDSVVNLTNTGANGAALNGPGFGGAAGNICMNVYAFSPDEQLVSCCSCLLTPNGLAALSIKDDLISNTLTGVRPNSVVVKVVPTAAGATFTGTSCTNSAAVAGQNATNPLIADGGLAWGTTRHALGTGFAVTENQFRGGTLSAQELASITNRCTNIIGNGSTFGVCRSCRAGGLNASKE